MTMISNLRRCCQQKEKRKTQGNIMEEETEYTFKDQHFWGDFEEYAVKFDPKEEEKALFDYLNCDKYADYAIQLIKEEALRMGVKK